MRMVFAGVGPLSPKDALDKAAQTYADRLTHYVRFELRTVDAAAGKNSSSENAERKEGERLYKLMPPNAHRVALHETGKLHTTVQLSTRLQGWLNTGRDVVFFQGGPTGLDAVLLKDANEQWSLSPLTLPHRLARVVALEALYRAFTVLKGEPYHKA